MHVKLNCQYWRDWLFTNFFSLEQFQLNVYCSNHVLSKFKTNSLLITRQYSNMKLYLRILILLSLKFILPQPFNIIIGLTGLTLTV